MEASGSDAAAPVGDQARSPRVVILVGAYRNDQQTSVWRYRAELLTPEALLLKEVAFGQNGGKTLLDLAVLRVDRSIEITPSEFQGMGMPASPSQPVSVRPVYQLGTPYLPFDDQNSCPLRSDGLELGDASAVATGSAVSAAGWYSEHAEKTSTRPSHHPQAMQSHTACAPALPAPIDRLTPPDGSGSLRGAGLQDSEQG